MARVVRGAESDRAISSAGVDGVDLWEAMTEEVLGSREGDSTGTGTSAQPPYGRTLSTYVGAQRLSARGRAAPAACPGADKGASVWAPASVPAGKDRELRP